MSINLSGHTQMQKYSIMSQLPQFIVEKNAPIKVKDYDYFNDKSWNNSQRSSRKNFNFYHKQVEEGKIAIFKSKGQEIVDQFQQEAQQKEYVNIKRVADYERMKSRKRERLILQMGSMQDIISTHPKEMNEVANIASERSTIDQQQQSNLIHSKAQAHLISVPLNGRTTFSWNKINEASKKIIDQTIISNVIKKDEDAVCLISKRIAQDKEVEALKQQGFNKFHDQTRKNFLIQHQKNYTLEQKSGLLPAEKPLIIFQSQLNSASYQKSIKNKIQNNNQQQDRLFLEQSSKSKSIADDSIPSFTKPPYLGSQTVRDNQHGYFHHKNANSSLQSFSAYGTSQNSPKQISEEQAQNLSSIKGLMSSNTSIIQKQIQLNSASSLSKDENLVMIHVNNKQNIESKQELAKINIEDESHTDLKKGNKPFQSQYSSIKDSDSKQKFYSQKAINDKNIQFPGSIQSTSHQRSMVIEEPGNERDFLSSAESHFKKTVNFKIIQNNNSSSLKYRSSSQQDNYSQSQHYFPLKNVEETVTNQLYNDESNYIKKHKRLEEISKPKQKEYIPKDYLDRTEYKGLLSAEVNASQLNAETDFTKAMIAGSSIISNQINCINSMRPSTQTSLKSRMAQTNSITVSFLRPQTTSSTDLRQRVFKNKQENDESNSYSRELINGGRSNFQHNYSSQNTSQDKNPLQEMDEFSKKRKHTKESKVGFSKATLLQFEYKSDIIRSNSQNYNL